eukprot:1145018-Pelagomonas_calceolata.AAC.1
MGTFHASRQGNLGNRRKITSAYFLLHCDSRKEKKNYMDNENNHLTHMGTQIAKQATTPFTKACYLTQTRALAMPSGTCPVSQPE